jgi:SmpA / OmlA family
LTLPADATPTCAVAAALVAAGLLFVPPIGRAQDLKEGTTGFLCCNMRSDGDWISDSNYAESGKYLIRLGAPVKLLGYGRYRVFVEIEGKRQALGNDYSRDLSMGDFARRYIVAADPRAALAYTSPKVRTAIESARVTPGMTREQVIAALGYPITSENPHLDNKRWRYWRWTLSPFTVHFNDAGTVRRVESDAETLEAVLLE